MTDRGCQSAILIQYLTTSQTHSKVSYFFTQKHPVNPKRLLQFGWSQIFFSTFKWFSSILRNWPFFRPSATVPIPYEEDLARFGTANHLLISVAHNSAGVGLQFAKSANLERGNDTKKPTPSNISANKHCVSWIFAWEDERAQNAISWGGERRWPDQMLTIELSSDTFSASIPLDVDESSTRLFIWILIWHSGSFLRRDKNKMISSWLLHRTNLHLCHAWRGWGDPVFCSSFLLLLILSTQSFNPCWCVPGTNRFFYEN